MSQHRAALSGAPRRLVRSSQDQIIEPGHIYAELRFDRRGVISESVAVAYAGRLLNAEHGLLDCVPDIRHAADDQRDDRNLDHGRQNRPHGFLKHGTLDAHNETGKADHQRYRSRRAVHRNYSGLEVGRHLKDIENGNHYFFSSGQCGSVRSLGATLLAEVMAVFTSRFCAAMAAWAAARRSFSNLPSAESILPILPLNAFSMVLIFQLARST